MKVFILIYWFAESDNYLVNSFEGAFSTNKLALHRKIELDPENKYIISGGEDLKIKLKEPFYYGDPFYEIRECEV